MTRLLISLFFIGALAFSTSVAYAATPIGGGDTTGTPVGSGGGGTPVGGGGGGTPIGGGGGVTPIGAGEPASGNCDGQTLCNPLKVDSLTGLLDLLLSAVIYLGSIVLVLMLIWVGFMFVTARGNPENISKARTALIWTIIGGLILLGARGIQAVISSTVSAL